MEENNTTTIKETAASEDLQQTVISLEVNGKEVKYSSDKRVATFTTSEGIVIRSKIPQELDDIKIFKFMKGLISADENLLG